MCVCVCVCVGVQKNLEDTHRDTNMHTHPTPNLPPPLPIASHAIADPPPHTHTHTPPPSWRPGMRKKAVVNKKFSKNGMKREVKLSGPGRMISSPYGSWPLAVSPTLSDQEGVAGSVTITALEPKQMICLSEASKGSNYT